MLNKLVDLYKVVISKVVEVETLTSGKTGEQKKEILVNYLAELYDIPGIPNFLETPAKKFAIGLIIDKVVEKLNVLTDWNFGGLNLTTSNIEQIAAITQAPVTLAIDSVKGMPTTAELDAKIADVYAKYNAVQPVEDSWTKAIAFALKWEGGKNYEGTATGAHTMLNPADKGGPTNMGITLPTLAKALAEGVIPPHVTLDGITREQVEAIYKFNYWKHYGWDELSHPVSLCALDCSINHGGFAWILQRACVDMGAQIAIDGKFGPATKDALKKCSTSVPMQMAQAVVNQRKVYYDRIVAKDPGQQANLNGWYNRLKAMAVASGVKSPV
jgi:peptidoglycan L-alanyl-D-glutamate endopeptidase CwlK